MTTRSEASMVRVLLRQPRHHLVEVGHRLGLELALACSAKCAQSIAHSSSGDWSTFPVATLKTWLRNLGLTGRMDKATALRRLRSLARRLTSDPPVDRNALRANASQMSLWPHQQAALNSCIDQLQPRVPVVVELPTGAGKSRLATALAHGFLTTYSKATVVWFAHRNGLVAQQIASVHALLPDARLRHLATRDLSVGDHWNPSQVGETRDYDRSRP